MFFYGESEYASANGGTSTDIVVGSKTYRVHKFTSSGQLTFSFPGTVEYLIVGGGGAGGAGFEGVMNSVAGTFTGNGGNAGQMITGTIEVQKETYNVVVGGYSGATGVASSAFNITASGGATRGSSTSPTSGIGASGGINGKQSDIDGTLRYYAGGGAQGGGYAGGLGGGGAGGNGWDGSPGAANTGGGGGGALRYRLGGFTWSRNGGAGGSGIVIVRYQIA
jgi:hypothetical protein